MQPIGNPGCLINSGCLFGLQANFGCNLNKHPVFNPALNKPNTYIQPSNNQTGNKINLKYIWKNNQRKSKYRREHTFTNFYRIKLPVTYNQKSFYREMNEDSNFNFVFVHRDF